MIIYSFRTAPFKDKLLEINTNSFIFSKLNEDFDMLSRQILKEKPDYIIGIAHSNNESRFESKTINQFNKKKKIALEGPRQLDLHVPQDAIFKVAGNASDSFCNWTAYKISKLVHDHKLGTKVVFAHVNENDLNPLLESLVHLE